MAHVIDLCERFPDRIRPAAPCAPTGAARIPIGYTIIAAMIVSGTVWTSVFLGAAAVLGG